MLLSTNSLRIYMQFFFFFVFIYKDNETGLLISHCLYDAEILDLSVAEDIFIYNM